MTRFAAIAVYASIVLAARGIIEAYAKEVARMQFMQYGLMHVEDSYLANYAEQMLKDEKQLRGIVERVAENKIYAALKGVAKIEEKEISHEDFGKLFA